MGIVGLLVVDSWERSLRIFIQRASHVTDDSCFRSGIGKEHPLVRHSVLAPYGAADIFDQLCNHSIYHRSARYQVRHRGLFLFRL